MLIDPVTTLLDPKPLALSAFVLTLYITTSVFQYKILDRVGQLLSNQNKQQDDMDDVEKERIKAIGSLDDVIKTVESSDNKLDEITKYLAERRTVLDNIVSELREVTKQQTVLATAQLNQTQSTNRVIDGLLEALSEQSKES